MFNSRHNETESARKLVKGTNDKFKILEKLSGIDNRQKQMQKSKLTKDFQAVLKRFQDVQKLAAEKGKISVSMAKATSFDLQNRIPDQTDDDKSGLLKYEALQKQRVEIENEVNFNEAVIAEREAGIKEIESTILEVNEIFRDLGTIVNEQQSMFDSIESNVEHTTIRTEGAAKELDRANEYQKRARAKMCCLITIIIAIGVIVLVVVLNL